MHIRPILFFITSFIVFFGNCNSAVPIYPGEIVVQKKDMCGSAPTEYCHLYYANYLLARDIRKKLWDKNWLLVSAESITGGHFSGAFTNVSDASKGFAGAIISYDVAIKNALLAVSEDTKVDVVSKKAVISMTNGLKKAMAGAKKIQQARKEKRIINVYIALTGYATTWKDDDNTSHKPHVFIGLKCPGQPITTIEKPLRHDLANSPMERVINIQAAVHQGLLFLNAHLD